MSNKSRQTKRKINQEKEEEKGLKGPVDVSSRCSDWDCNIKEILASDPHDLHCCKCGATIKFLSPGFSDVRRILMDVWRHAEEDRMDRNEIVLCLVCMRAMKSVVIDWCKKQKIAQ
jgi:hypothetical protein